MKLTLRSLRLKLAVLYTVFALISMVCLGCFSYVYMNYALETSRQVTMQAREERFVRFIETWPEKDKTLSLTEKLDRLSIAIAATDIIQVYELDGTPIYSSPGASAFKVPWPHQPCIERCFGLVRQYGHSIRTLNHVVTMDGRQLRLSLSGKIDEHAEMMENVRNSYLLFCPLLLIASAAGGFVLSDRALRPVRQMTAEARSIGIHDLKRRLPIPNTSDELQVLAETWNELLERLHTAVSRLTQFTEDISHDLGTTITVMLTTASLALHRKRTAEEYRAALRTITTECEATSRLLQDLLAVTRADMVQQHIDMQLVPLSELVCEVADNLRAKANLKHQTLQASIASDAWTMGDPSLLRRMVGILLDNAIKYTPEHGAIAVSITSDLQHIHLKVQDNGIGIAPEALPRIFDRFYRVDPSRTQEEGSSGLGLAIAQWVAGVHGAAITAASTPGNGSEFSVTMPLATEIPSAELISLAAEQ
ncbi:HAMP domain-containing protein [Terriglobus albidus]|uniref:histidine kinase n=1 Tax=Terriglobus albidus TaxID=1592106 RepID=A0A5B9EGQ4_9BACT|nr:ATP-binding protein [Terriglobus albidus]QEE30774.1 HAMP domain-containing protein [Terriglobus albidus]